MFSHSDSWRHGVDIVLIFVEHGLLISTENYG